MLTSLLREKGHKVISWIENCDQEGNPDFNFKEWIKTDEAKRCFTFDTEGAMFSDLLIYYGNAGKDAAAETGAAYGKGVPIVGLFSKGEDFGLMRKMISQWVNNIPDLLHYVDCEQVSQNKKIKDRF